MKNKKMLQVGDYVIKNDKYFVKEVERQVYIVRSDPQDICGTTCVFLEGVSGAYAMDGLTKIIMPKEEKVFSDTFYCALTMSPKERKSMFDSGVFNEIAIGYGKLALDEIGLTGKSIVAFEAAMRRVFDMYGSEAALCAYQRVDV